MLHIDAIEREVLLPAVPAVVWEKSFATPGALSSWFPERIEGAFGEGEAISLIWGEHRCEALVVEYQPGKALAYQWHPGGPGALDAHPREELTTVRFTLDEHPEGTLVRMVESGFSRIPEDRRQTALEENTGGWKEELAKLPQGYQA